VTTNDNETVKISFCIWGKYKWQQKA